MQPPTSELGHRKLDTGVNGWAQAGANVDPAPEERGQVKFEGYEVQQCPTGLKIDEEAEVARVVSRLTDNGAEHSQPARTVATGDCDDIAASRAKLTERHCRRADTAPARHT